MVVADLEPRCEVCGRLIAGQPVTRKTCCVNKLYVFCSEMCLRKWTQTWLRRQEQIAVSHRGPMRKLAAGY
ncbi:MAG: TRASH domain-containing protein [Candidatus Bathyarchaeia archaeon]